MIRPPTPVTPQPTPPDADITPDHVTLEPPTPPEVGQPRFLPVLLGTAGLNALMYLAVNHTVMRAGLTASPPITGLTAPLLLAVAAASLAAQRAHSRRSLRLLTLLGLQACGMITLASAFLGDVQAAWLPALLCLISAADLLRRAFRLSDQRDSHP